MSGRHLFTWSAVVCLTTLVAYLLSMPGSITLEDAGLFQMVCHGGGISHPPGYPLFTLACQGFVSLPFFDTGVFAGNLLSAIFASLTCAVLVVVVMEMTGDWRIAALTAMAYGLSNSFWSQAIIIEVYSLAALLFVFCLWLGLVYRRTRDVRVLYGLALASGLALSNHWPLHLLATPALLLALVPVWREPGSANFNLKHLPGLILVFGAGLLPYLSLFQAEPQFAIYGAIETPDQFFNYVSRAPYEDQFAGAGWDDKLAYQLWLWQQTAKEFSWLLAPLLLAGVIRSFRVLDRYLAMSMLLLYFGATGLLVLLLGFEFSDLRTAIFRPYLILAHLAPAVWLGLGCFWLADSLKVQAGRVATLIPIALLAAVAVSNLPDNYRRNDSFAAIYAERVFEATNENALLFVTGDTGVGVLGYLHHIEGVRPDIELRSWNSLVFSNRLTSAFAPQQVLDETRRRYIEASDSVVLSNTRPDFPAIHRGLVFEMDSENSFSCSDEVHDYIRYLLNIDAEAELLLDAHERELLFGLLLEFTRQHVGLAMFNADVTRGELETLQSLQGSFAGRLGTLETLLQYPQDASAKDLLQEIADSAARVMPSGTSSQVRGLLDEYRGRIALIDPPDRELAAAHFESSLESWPVVSNSSRCVLVATYEAMGRTGKAERVRKTLASANDCLK